MRNNFIINTDSLYFEVDKNYTSLAINFNAVERASKQIEVKHLSDEKKYSQKTAFSWESLKDLIGGAGKARPNFWKGMANWDRDEEEISSFGDQVYYEVVVNWSSLDNGYIKEWKVVSNPMSLADARKEKKEIVDQMYRKGPILEAIEKYLDDEDELTLGLLGDECEREIAKIIRRNLDKVKELK